VKQELAGRILGLLNTEERRLGPSVSVSAECRQPDGGLNLASSPHRSFETSHNTRKPVSTATDNCVQTEMSGGTSSVNSSLTSAGRLAGWRGDKTRSEENYEEEVAAVLAQRTQHMRRIRREMRKLEKLDAWVAGAAARGGGSAAMVADMSELSIQTTVSTVATEETREDMDGGSTFSVSQSSSIKMSRTVTESVEEGEKRFERKREKRVRRGKENIVPVISRKQEVEEGRKNITTSTNITLTSVQIQTETVDSSGSTYRDERRSGRREKRRTVKERKGKAVAYYLPLPSCTPIRLGSRVIRESSSNLAAGRLSSVHRTQVASYMASIDPNPRHSTVTKLVEDVEEVEPVICLQAALMSKRSDFVRKSEARQRMLANAREARLLKREKQAIWLEEVVGQSPRTRRLAMPSYTPVHIPQVFSHKDMVVTSREKYLKLQEVRDRQAESKKNNRYKTNRLMAEIYSSRLQRKVVRGQVSLTHHVNVI